MLSARGQTILQIFDTFVMFVCACVCVFKLHAVQLAVSDKKENRTREPQSNRLVRLDDIEQLDAEMCWSQNKFKNKAKKNKKPNIIIFFLLQRVPGPVSQDALNQ